MAITASSPDAFFDGEDFEWTATLTEEDGVTPLVIGPGDRLFARFKDDARIIVGVCDSAASDQSLVVTDGSVGAVTFLIPAQGRTWTPPFLGLLRLGITANVFGDLYRYPAGSTKRQGVTRFELTVLPGTGTA